MQYTQEAIDKNAERGSPDSTDHTSAANTLPIRSMSTAAIGLTEAQGMSPFIPLYIRWYCINELVDNLFRPQGDPQLPSHVFPYGAEVCLTLDPLQRGMPIT